MKKTHLALIFLMILSFFMTQTVSAKDILVADTGFRVGKDGFGFENYGSQVCSSGYSMFGGSDCYRVQNLTSAEMVRLFGDQVCKSVTQDGKCTLTKVAEQWMNEINSVVANGHCEGMAVLSSLFYSGLEKPSDYGSSSVNKLQLKNNIPLQREIAYWFTTQWFMDDHLIEKDPTSQVKYLINHFNSEPNTPIPLGIYQRNLSGGHAITAYAVVDHGNGIYYIMVYDNNYPNQERYITVDTNKNSWSYQTSTNPWMQTGNYSGQGKTNPIQIGPIEPRLGTFRCDFCTKQPASNPWQPYQPSQPSDSSDYSIWDILSPWMVPSDSSSPSTRPTATPVPYQPSDSGYSIWDILSPWIDGGDYVEPTAVPDSGSGYSIWDIFSPWLAPDGSGSSSSSSSGGWSFPTQTPQSGRSVPTAVPTAKPTAVPTAKPLVRPTAIPTPIPVVEDDGVEKNKISVASDINIYIETDDDLRAGYDWETDETFYEIPGVEVSRSMGRSSALLPNNLKYYLWMNYPESEVQKTFDAVITSPGRYLKLTNIQEAYGSPNFIYTPPTYHPDMDMEFEAFEVIANGDELPGVDFTITDEYGEYNFKFETNMRNGRRKTPDAPVDFLIFHNYEQGEIGIWISALYDEDVLLFGNATFDVAAEFTLWDKDGELHVTTPKSKPISLSDNGMFFFNYVDWQNGEGLNIKADLDGDDSYETNRTLK
ncbi:MAG: PT domain-containing protein [Flexilinea sp.]|nr:PT domain-containing protein [Flexilinea sp.]